MIVLRAVLIVIFGCSLAAVTAFAVFFAAFIVFPPQPNYDRAHPDYAHFAARFADARRAFATGEDYASSTSRR